MNLFFYLENVCNEKTKQNTIKRKALKIIWHMLPEANSLNKQYSTE